MRGSPQVVAATAPVTAYPWITGISSASFSGSAAGSNSVVMAPFITPLSRRVRVRLRVSMPSMPMIPFFCKNASSVISQRKLLGAVHASRTMYPRAQMRPLSISSLFKP